MLFMWSKKNLKNMNQYERQRIACVFDFSAYPVHQCSVNPAILRPCVLEQIQLKSPEHWNKTKFIQKRSLSCQRKANEMNLTHEKLFLCVKVCVFKANINDERFDKKKVYYVSIGWNVEKKEKQILFHFIFLFFFSSLRTNVCIG